MAQAQYGTLITTIGLAQIANAQITQSKVGLENIALGDGNGAHYVPTQNQTALVHEVWRGPITELSIDPTNSNRIIVDAVIPVTAGGFTIREIGIFDDKNQLIAVGQYPEKYKPQLSEGVSEETIIHFVIETNNADVVKLNIDPTVIIASRPYVDGKVAQVQKALTEHSDEKASKSNYGHMMVGDGLSVTNGVVSVDIPKIQDASTTQKGVVKLNDTLVSSSVTEAATSNAVKKVNDKLGELTALKTIDKTNIVAAINELFTNVSDGKTKIAAATTDQGVSTSPNVTFDQMAANIRRIQRGRKWAVGSGYVGNSYEYSTGGSSFPFKPEIIILAKIKNGTLMEHAVYVTKNNYFHLNPPYDSNFYTFRDETAPVGHRDQMQYGQVTFEQHSNSWGWTMRISTNAIPANCNVTWIAFGPHEQ